MRPQTNLSQNRQLNPFVFPIETQLRYTMMVLVAVVFVWTLGFFGSDLLGPEWSSVSITESAGGIINQLIEALPTSLSTKPEIKAFAEEFIPLAKELTFNGMSALAFPGGLTLVVFAVALVIYRAYPLLIRNSRKLQPVVPGEDPEFWDAICSLVSTTGISPAPALQMEKNSLYAGGQAFGFRKSYFMRLGKRMRLLMRKSPDDFKTIILHELGHIENQDLHRTYFTQALWAVVAGLIILFLMAWASLTLPGHIRSMLSEGITDYNWKRFLTVSLPAILTPIFQLGISLAMITAIRASILRVREVYADWRVAQWGAGNELSSILARKHGNEIERRRWFRINIWHLHPTFRERLSALGNPAELFRVTAELPFFSGFLLAYIIDVGMLIIPSLFQTILGITVVLYLDSLLFLIEGPAVITLAIFILLTLLWLFFMIVLALSYLFGLAYMITGTVGIQVQREAIADLATNQNRLAGYLSLWKPALFTVFGVEIGFFTILWNPLLAVNVWWALIFFCVTWLWLMYVRFVSIHLLGTYWRLTPPRAWHRILVAILVMLSWVLYVPIIDYAIIPSLAIPWPLALSGSFFLFFLIFIGTWVLLRVRKSFIEPHCPSCKKTTHHTFSVGQTCEHCGQELAPWLYSSIHHTGKVS